MGGAAERERLDDPACGQGTTDLALAGPFPPGSDGKLSRGIELGRDGAQAAHDAYDGLGAHRVKQLPPHTPCEGLRPIQRHHRRLTRLAAPLAQSRRCNPSAGS